VFLPTWATDLVKRARRMNPSDAPREAAAMPVLLHVMHHNVQTVAQCCEVAAREGIRQGMTIAHARALLDGRDAVIEPLDAARTHRALRRLAVWATRYSPVVAPDPPDGLHIDITGTERLHGGESRLLLRIASDLMRRGFQVRLATASTHGCAWAVARYGSSAMTIIPGGQESQALASLHVAGLRIDAEAIAGLNEVDIDRIGQLAALPRRDIAVRFGANVLLRLDQGLGQAFEVIRPIRLRPVPRAEREFDGPTTQTEAIEITVRELLGTLCTVMQQREQGIRRLELALLRIDAPPEIAVITLSVATRCDRHLWKLVRPKVERMNLGFGLLSVILTVTRAARMAHEQANQWPTEQGDAEQTKAFGELIDTLIGRLGDERVLAALPVESYVPELAFRMVPITAAMKKAMIPADIAIAAPERPSVLFPQPMAVEVTIVNEQPVSMRWRGSMRKVVTCIGPECIALPWWRHSHSPLLAREYYQVQDDRGGWWWLYRFNQTGRWHLHGQWA